MQQILNCQKCDIIFCQDSKPIRTMSCIQQNCLYLICKQCFDSIQNCPQCKTQYGDHFVDNLLFQQMLASEEYQLKLRQNRVSEYYQKSKLTLDKLILLKNAIIKHFQDAIEQLQTKRCISTIKILLNLVLTTCIVIPNFCMGAIIIKPIYDIFSTGIEIIQSNQTSGIHIKINEAFDQHDEIISSPAIKQLVEDVIQIKFLEINLDKMKGKKYEQIQQFQKGLDPTDSIFFLALGTFTQGLGIYEIFYQLKRLDQLKKFEFQYQGPAQQGLTQQDPTQIDNAISQNPEIQDQGLIQIIGEKTDIKNQDLAEVIDENLELTQQVLSEFLIENKEINQYALSEIPNQYALSEIPNKNQQIQEYYLAESIGNTKINQYALSEIPNQYALSEITNKNQQIQEYYLAESIGNTKINQYALSEIPNQYALSEITNKNQQIQEYYLAESIGNTKINQYALSEIPNQYALSEIPNKNQQIQEQSLTEVIGENKQMQYQGLSQIIGENQEIQGQNLVEQIGKNTENKYQGLVERTNENSQLDQQKFGEPLKYKIAVGLLFAVQASLYYKALTLTNNEIQYLKDTNKRMQCSLDVFKQFIVQLENLQK